MIFNLIHALFTLYSLAIIIRALMTWLRPDPSNPVYRFLVAITEPVLTPLRRYIPPMGGLDFTPLIALVLLSLLERLLILVLVR